MLATLAAPLAAQETTAGGTPGASAEPEAAPAENEAASNERTLFEYLRQPDLRPIRSLLVEQEMPLVGIRWGAEVRFDIPLNNEPDGAEPTLREGKLVFYRAFGSNVSAKVTANYNNLGQFEIGDSYLTYSGWKTWKATLGIFRPAYSLERMSKTYGLTFMERALPVNALSERRSGGISMLKRTSNDILDVGLYFFSPDQEGQSEKGQAVVLHYVHAPLQRDSGLRLLGGRDIWAGVSLSYRVNADADDTRYRSRPEVNVGDDYFVDTGPIAGADSILRLGIEASKVAGSFSWQGEILSTQVRRNDFPDVSFTGGYVFLSWFLTGETRNYNSVSGEYLGVEPAAPVGQGGWGAWEVALRASTVDLTDQDIAGGRQKNLSAGLNWYLNENFRVQANLVKVLDVDRPGSPFDGKDPLIAALRVQWYLP